MPDIDPEPFRNFEMSVRSFPHSAMLQVYCFPDAADPIQRHLYHSLGMIDNEVQQVFVDMNDIDKLQVMHSVEFHSCLVSP